MTSVREAVLTAAAAADCKPDLWSDAFERELEARGFAVVPVSLTEMMRVALDGAAEDGMNPDDTWEAAIAVRPRVGKEG